MRRLNLTTVALIFLGLVPLPRALADEPLDDASEHVLLVRKQNPTPAEIARLKEIFERLAAHHSDAGFEGDPKPIVDRRARWSLEAQRPNEQRIAALRAIAEVHDQYALDKLTTLLKEERSLADGEGLYDAIISLIQQDNELEAKRELRRMTLVFPGAKSAVPPGPLNRNRLARELLTSLLAGIPKGGMPKVYALNALGLTATKDLRAARLLIAGYSEFPKDVAHSMVLNGLGFLRQESTNKFLIDHWLAEPDHDLRINILSSLYDAKDENALEILHPMLPTIASDRADETFAAVMLITHANIRTNYDANDAKKKSYSSSTISRREAIRLAHNLEAFAARKDVKNKTTDDALDLLERVKAIAAPRE